jgi:hypothetical protein
MQPVREIEHPSPIPCRTGELAAAFRPLAAARALACDHSHQIRIRRPLFDLT